MSIMDENALDPWAKTHPYSYQQGAAGQPATGGVPSNMSMPNIPAAPTGGGMPLNLSMPSQQAQAPPTYQPSAPPTGAVVPPPSGGDEGDTGEESKSFASAIGQGVLASSQAGASQALAQGQKKKKPQLGQSDSSGGGMGAGFGSTGMMGGEV